MIYSFTNNYGEILEISLNSIEKAIMAIFSYDLTAPIKVGIVTSYDPEIQRFKKGMEKYKWEK